MITGMLWFDNDKKESLASKVERAAQYYKKKYGKAPDICFINPKMLESQPEETPTDKIELKPSQTVLPHHFWIGTKEQKSI